MIEDMGQARRRYADAGVGYGKGHADLSARALFQRRLDPDVPRFRKFYRIAYQVDEDLVQAVRITVQHFRYRGIYIQLPTETFFLQPVGKHGRYITQHIREPELDL